LRERLFSRLIIDQETGCLLWTGGTAKFGYGRVSVNGYPQHVHQVMYEMFVGPVPDGLELDHLCRVPRCASPAHLEAVTHKVNMLRSQTPAAANATKTHCDRGHEYDLLNTYFAPGTGHRQCRACNQDRERRRSRRKTAE
jgi:hypothetical protein